MGQRVQDEVLYLDFGDYGNSPFARLWSYETTRCRPVDELCSQCHGTLCKIVG